MMLIQNKFDIEEKVYKIHDPDQIPWMVLSIHVMRGGMLRYVIARGSLEESCYEFEISHEPYIEWNINNKKD